MENLALSALADGMLPLVRLLAVLIGVAAVWACARAIRGLYNEQRRREHPREGE